MTHICFSKVTNIGSNNGLSPGRGQAIIWTNAGILLIWPWGTNFSQIFIEIHIFSFKKIYLKLSSAKVAAILCRGRWVNYNQGKTLTGYPDLTVEIYLDHIPILVRLKRLDRFNCFNWYKTLYSKLTSVCKSSKSTYFVVGYYII